MTEPQSGIFTEGTTAHRLLEYALDDVSDPSRLIAALSAAVHAKPVTRDGIACVIAFGSDLWSRVARQCGIDWEPDGLGDFRSIDGGVGHRAPATQTDLFVWLHGRDTSEVFDAMLAAHGAIGDVAELETDVQGFIYHDLRDLTGFIDGTDNPHGAEARRAALIAAGKAGAGGSFVLGQRWVHDLASFHALPVDEQEKVIGRTKSDSVELPPDKMPPDAHVARVEAERDGVEQEIYRRSVPYGQAHEHGLYFLAFACDRSRFDFLLARMFGTAGDDLHDRLTDFTRPVTSSYWFAPDAATLHKIVTAD